MRHAMSSSWARKSVRCDRTSLYCIVRAMQPNTFIETGTRWGLGSLFILSAMERNERGHLYSFDLGVEGSKMDYFWPRCQSELGFLVPSRLAHYFTIVEGDSLQTLPDVLETLPAIDIFYHDSLHTFDHMLAEYQLVYPHMNQNGLFMSEDTDKNDAWKEFVCDKEFRHEGRYSSHLGISNEREVRSIRLSG